MNEGASFASYDSTTQWSCWIRNWINIIGTKTRKGRRTRTRQKRFISYHCFIYFYPCVVDIWLRATRSWSQFSTFRQMFPHSFYLWWRRYLVFAGLNFPLLRRCTPPTHVSSAPFLLAPAVAFVRYIKSQLYFHCCCYWQMPRPYSLPPPPSQWVPTSQEWRIWSLHQFW